LTPLDVAENVPDTSSLTIIPFMRTLFRTGLGGCDVEFKVRLNDTIGCQSKLISAHRIIVAGRCPALSKMITESSKSQKTSQQALLQIDLSTHPKATHTTLNALIEVIIRFRIEEENFCFQIFMLKFDSFTTAIVHRRS
jgi:hypothetical protein